MCRLASILFKRSVKVDGVLTNADSTPTIKIIRLDTNAVVVNTTSTGVTNPSTGMYEYLLEDAESGVTYRATWTFIVDGETFQSDKQVVAPGTYRITEADVEGILDFDPSIEDLTPFIAAAEELVTQLSLTDCGAAYSADRLRIIETWLAAHFLAIRDPRYQSETMGAASVTKALGQMGMNLGMTPYGQQAMLLDTCGWLAWLDKHISQGKRGKVSVLWLGTNQRSLVDFPWRFFGLFG